MPCKNKMPEVLNSLSLSPALPHSEIPQLHSDVELAYRGSFSKLSI